jgi:gas vesicle protein
MKEYAMNENSSTTSSVILALVSGAVLGAGLALLYAPQSGRKTRRALQDLGEEASDYARDVLGRAERGVKEAARTGQAWAQKGKDFIDDKGRQAGAAAAEGAKSGY